MLSRVAERIYWMSRYMERSENVARLVNVNSHLLMDLPRGIRVGWGSLIKISGTGDYFNRGDTEEADERTVVRFMLSDRDNPASLLNSLSWARENARITREIIPMEAWELINNLYLEVKDNLSKSVARRERNRVLHTVIASIQQFTGLLAGCMSHNSAYDFIRIGRNLERADMTTRIVDAGSANLLPHLSGEEDVLEPYDNILWMSVLRSLSAYQMYSQHVQDRVNAEDVVTFLLQDGMFPRSVSHSLGELESCLHKLPNSDEALRAVTGVRRRLRSANIPELLESGLQEYVDNVQLEVADIHRQIANTWFLPVAPQAQSQ
ncbi:MULTISPECIES: alpha-E domain-containing protein [Marinimicrobium]|uniref:Putative alpha-E superfamily protein n=1 Tax=Marinimicrobium koreense TaxID=306545 RepID=A0A3N1NWY7_9GAMM|nr:MULTISPECIES: alpha-E domain-containing protein [Marinimicrobium]MAN51591.1 alpha-E domain-containing protein [Marinimicrobium sp.]ROQ20683.1 putative alpha-E superfamily protein [Marinimicrobium koreense]UZJ45950.1 alpha-E domain-containing protein [Marinimicrobium sp. C6131]